MIFNSLPFLAFIVVFMLVYYLVEGKLRLWWCLLASYYFYGFWDWRFLGLIGASTLLDFWVGKQLYQTVDEKIRKRWLWLSMAVNLGVLAFFKYFNFFADSLNHVASLFGEEDAIETIKLIQVVGISFYTFQSMSYTIDIYRRVIVPESSLLRFATYIAFFPQLVAGPIVRAREFLPQFSRPIDIDEKRLILGFSLVLWGFFKKVAIADSLAPFVDQCFSNPENHSALHLSIGMFFYAFQIYCDFSGYSDIAIGIAKMLGFDFPTNFRSPYFSKGFSEFWQRWHITLSSWLRDYLYIPLGGNRSGTWNTFRNLMITMLLGGLWHGANWVFVCWGALHGIYLILERLWKTMVRPYERLPHFLYLPYQLGAIIMVFSLTCLAWVFFRSPDFDTAWQILRQIAAMENLSFGAVTNKFIVLKSLILILGLAGIEWLNPFLDIKNLLLVHPPFRLIVWCGLLWCIALMGTFGNEAFIYFQF